MSHYKTLGVGESASADEIKRAYKKLAKKHHPDANPDDPNAEEMFKQISAAYSIIGDSAKRTKYDNEQKMQASGGGFGGGFGGFSGFDPFSNFMGGANPFDILREAGQALNIQTALQIDFLDAKENQVQPVKFHRRKPCLKCRGSGAKDYHAAGCPTCRGRGQVTRTLGGVLHTTQMCQMCKGKGKLIKTKCAHCQEGSTPETAEINVHIPAGIVTNKVLRLQGEGHRSIDGKGDLLIKITVAPDRRWVRNGATVMSSVEVTYPTLVLGGDVDIETIWGKERVTIPPRTKSGSKLALHNKGFPRLGKILPNERGTHLLTVELDLPSDNSKQHQDLLKKLQEFYAQ